MAEVLGAGRFLRLVRDQRWEWAERTNAHGVVVIVATTPRDEVLLVEQHRIPVGARVLEMPAGLAGDDGSSEAFGGAAGATTQPSGAGLSFGVEAAEPRPSTREALATAAARELEEETGWRAGRIEWLTAGPVSAGMTSEVLTFFRAHDLVQVGAGGGVDGEDIVVHTVPRAEVREWLAQRHAEGVMADPKVYAGLYFLGLNT
ncbi:MAG: NUDIX hydrolase [Myxococcota bacterium]